MALPAQLGSARQWRRIERSVVRDHAARVTAQLQELRGLPLSGAVMTPSGLVAITVAEWTVVLAGVSLPAARPMVESAGGWQLEGAGRYGRFWWVAAASLSEPLRSLRCTIAGSHLRLDRARTGSGGGRQAAPYGGWVPASVG